ncbi:MAG: N-acetylmuramoyl-L-alanine amidase [Desulfobacterales bacterium]|nr:N-acetylmuramoyl-L-alanine amidase [Desulfobacterales bacterium]
MIFRKSHIIYIAFILICLFVFPAVAFSASAKEKYFVAERSYYELKKDTKKIKYRDNWLRCIEKFQSAYQQDPGGSWAAASLYMSGKLYAELYKLSYLSADKKEAIDHFERIIKRFPQSLYKQKATEALKTLSGKAVVQTTTTTTTTTTLSTTSKSSDYKDSKAKGKYLIADKSYRELRKSSRKQKYRDNWLRCIEKFQAAYSYDPTGSWAAAGLYMSGNLYGELYKKSYKASDKQDAIDIYKKVVSKYPDSAYCDKAAQALNSYGIKTAAVEYVPDIDTAGTSSGDSISSIISSSASSPSITNTVAATSGSPGTVSALRFWSNPNYTRVVIDADRESTFAHRLLKKDPSINKPQRLYVDVHNSRLGKDLQKVIPINDDLLINARAGQYTTNAVRVVVDIKSFENYNIFSLRNPFRIVIDVWGKNDSKTVASLPPTIQNYDSKAAAGSLATQLSLGVQRIVIDAGHGGKDYGAPGYLKGVHEKDIALQIANRLAQKIRRELNFDVILTRTTDRYLTLEERTAIANTKNADLFISIHTNAARDKRAYGVETYILNLATDEDAIMVAARENATSTKNISDLQTILSDLMRNTKIDESARLATHVQRELYSNLKKNYSSVKNKGVKQAPFYVLLGARMPAVLIETSFISNERECKRLTNPTYQEKLCEGILKGVKKYINETNPTAFININSTASGS